MKMNETNKWLEIERKWREEWKKEFPEDAKKLEESFQKDFADMNNYSEELLNIYGKKIEKLTEEFAKRFSIIELKADGKKINLNDFPDWYIWSKIDEDDSIFDKKL